MNRTVYLLKFIILPFSNALKWFDVDRKMKMSRLGADEDEISKMIQIQDQKIYLNNKFHL